MVVPIPARYRVELTDRHSAVVHAGDARGDAPGLLESWRTANRNARVWCEHAVRRQ